MVTMSNDLTVPASFGAVPKAFANKDKFVNDDLSSGISTGYAVVGYRGKVWRTKHRGEERPIMRPDGDGPESSLRVVIVRAAANKSKIFYKNGYVEGSSAPPDCWSSNGATPDPMVQSPQHANCLACPQNKPGSKVTPSGKPARACSDSKRLAVVPLDDLDNEMFNGPMLLRVPGASLTDLVSLNQKMKSAGYPYQSYGVKISFDVNEAYPKFTYSAIRPLTDEEADKVAAYYEDPRTLRILAEDAGAGPAPAKEAPAQLFEQPAPKQVEAKKPATKEVKKEAEAPKADAKSFDAALEDLI